MDSHIRTDKKRIVFPGTFDPFTAGHLDVARRALLICDELYIAVFDNSNKVPVADRARRVDLIRKSLDYMDQVKVIAADGLLVDFCLQHGIATIVRGIRNLSQYEEEEAMAQINRLMGKGIDTMFLPALPGMRHVSSSLVRELLRLGAEVEDLVPPAIKSDIVDIYGKTSGDEADMSPQGGRTHE